MILRKLLTVATAVTTLAIAGCESPTGSSMGMGSDLNLGEGQYTILLDTAHGPSHHDRIQAYKRIIMQNMDWPGSDLLVVRREDEEATSLYYDTFESFDAAARRLKQIRRIKTPTGKKPFDTVHVQVVPVPGSQMGPPEWDLTNTKGAYTFCVGRWYNMPDKGFYLRRENALLHCKHLREQGYEAYYYHGQTESLVTIGLFGPDAVELRKVGERHKPVIVDPRVRRLQRDPKVATFLENGWTGKDRQYSFDPKAKRVALDSEGKPVANEQVLKSRLVEHPHKDAAATTATETKDNPNAAINRPGVPKPW